MERVLEVCVDSLASARAAVRGGATRLELCRNLVIGGTTPEVSLLKAVRRETGLPVRCLLRPRFGDFLYTEEELSLMVQDAQALLDAGADGIVSGCLTPEGDLDEPHLRVLVEITHGKEKRFTLHRAFDVCRDAFSALERCRALRVDTVLTSGQADRCVDGLELIRALFPKRGDVELLIGAGVDAAAIRAVRKIIPQAASFHLSGKISRESGMRFRREGVHMGLPGLDEFTLMETDEANIRAAWAALREA